MHPTPADLGPIRDLYHQGRYRQALAAGERLGPPRSWEGPAGRLLAGRLAIQLGAPRAGRRLHLLAFRESPAYLEAVYYHARYRLEHFGPLSCWRFLKAHPDWSDAPPELRADWLAVSALCAARVRDFDRADRFLAQAEALAPNRPWVHVERSSVLELGERSAEALTSARRALELHPWFRPAVQAVGHLLHRAGRDADAVEFLTEAVDHLESGAVAAQLAALEIDLNRPADAAGSLDRYADLSPLMEPDGAKWLAARRADVAYLLGDYGEAGRQARQVGEEFYTAFADALEAAKPLPASARTLLALDLAYRGPPPSMYDLLSRFWDRPVPAPPADAPPVMDGLPDAADRRRFDAAGWVTREFTLTPAAAAAVVARGVPFLVTLVEAGFGQHRVVLGADAVRGTVFLTDGQDRRPAEAPVAVLTKRYAAFGPRCLAVVPEAEADRLRGLDLPDAAAYDRLHAVQAALLDRKFTDAKAALDRLRGDCPGHRLVKYGAVAWARATAHPVLLLDAVTGLLADFPHDATLVLTKAAVLRELGRSAERLDLLREEGVRPDAEPLLVQSLAQVLLPDPAAQYQAAQLLRRSVRVRPHAAAGYFLLASQWWEQQQFADAVDLYRFAACLDDREDQFAEAYFKAARAAGQAPEALRVFQQKATRAAVPHPPAVRALFNALLDRDEPEQAFAAVGRAVEKLTASGGRQPPGANRVGEGAEPVNGLTSSDGPHRGADAPRSPELAEILLFRAEVSANAGRFADADADLDAARGLAPPAVWHRSAARVARTKPDYAAALAHLRDLLQADPLSPDAHRLTASLLADTEGRAAAREYLDGVARRYPDVYPLAKLRAEFVYADPDDAAVAATKDLLALCPHDAWALRQLALVYGDRKRNDEALAAVTEAGKYEPDHPSQFAVLAHVHRRADRVDEALDAFRDAVRHYPDHELAIFEMVQLGRGLKEKKAALRFVAEQLHAAPHTGDGLVAYFEQAHRLIDDPDELGKLLAELERFLDERPDLWQAWSVVAQGMLTDHRAEEAVRLAREAADRFPLVARVWVDLAEACRATEQAEERIDALRQAVAVAPGWVPAVRELADALAEQGRDDEAVSALRRLAVRTPLDPTAHWFLADRLWDAGRGREGLDRAKAAVRLDPGFDPRVEAAWHAVMVWSDRLDAPEEAADLARALTRDRAGDPRAWLRLARCLNEPSEAGEALAALEHAIRLDPRNVEAFDVKAERLAAMGRFDEALEAARPAELAAELPIVLQGRAAWVEARRGNFAAAIPPMQALVSVDPDYVWGWQQLAEWYNETNRPENYLEAASELARLRPESPLSLTMRGEAKLQTGDRDGGKEDLREALRIHPGYSAAAVILFDACLADRELKDARSALAVLQEHLSGPEVLVKQIQFAARTGDEDGAARAFAELCHVPGDGPPLFLQMGLTELATAGWEERAGALLRDAWESGDEFSPWAAIFWLDTPAGDAADPADRLAACDAVLAAYPQFVPGFDRRAEQLAKAGRYEEAATACTPEGIGPPVPVALRGRAAWVEAQRGDKAKAVELMKGVVAEEPDYGWGWRQLTQWYDALGRPRDFLDAADQLVRLNPDDPMALAVRGEARRLLDDHRGANDDYRRAYELDPSFDAAGLQLVSSQLATDDVAGAARTLEALKENSDGPVVRLRAVQVAARQGALAAAREGFRALAADPAAPRGVLRDAAAALSAAGWEAEADEELTDAVTRPECTSAAAGFWVERQVLAGRPWQAADRFCEVIAANADAGREAVLTYAWAVAAADPGATAATVQRYAEPLRATDEGWARAGAALAEARNYALAAAWLNDWKDRPGCRGWMLRPLADALRSLDRDAEAEAVARAAVALDPADETPPDFRAWLALSAAVDGRTAEAVGFLDDVDDIGLPDGLKLVLAMAEALVAVQEAAPAEKAHAFTEAKEDLKAAAGACAERDLPPGAVRWYRRTVARLAADAGGLAAKAWAIWQRARPWVKE